MNHASIFVPFFFRDVCIYSPRSIHGWNHHHVSHAIVASVDYISSWRFVERIRSDHNCWRLSRLLPRLHLWIRRHRPLHAQTYFGIIHQPVIYLKVCITVFMNIYRMKAATNNMGHLAVHANHDYPDSFTVFNHWIGATKTDIQVTIFFENT